MKVVHLSTFGTRGGAARAAARVHASVLAERIDSSMHVLRDPAPELGIGALPAPRRIGGRLTRRARIVRHRFREPTMAVPRRNGFERFSDSGSTSGRDVRAAVAHADIVHLHWIAGFVDYSLLPYASAAGKKIVWTMHDMNPFTGGCHYDAGCGRFADRCGACPQIESASACDLSFRVLQRKERLLSRLPPSDLWIVTPSRWLGDEVGRSRVMGRFPRSVIPYGLELDVFRPRPRPRCRELLGVPPERHVLLFVAQTLGNRRKGLGYMLDAVSFLRRRDGVVSLMLGRGEGSICDWMPCISLGTVRDDRLLAVAYGAADLFVIPSLQDNLPNTVMEAMACGTPAVGFRAGGIGEMIRDDETGLLVPTGDSRAMARAIEGLLDMPDRAVAMSKASRRVAEAEYDSRIQGRRYAELYRRILRGE